MRCCYRLRFYCDFAPLYVFLRDTSTLGTQVITPFKNALTFEDFRIHMFCIIRLKSTPNMVPNICSNLLGS